MVINVIRKVTNIKVWQPNVNKIEEAQLKEQPPQAPAGQRTIQGAAP